MINQLNFYSNADTSITDVQNTLDATFIGKESVSLTEWLTTTESQIAAGSILENNGTLFEVTTDTDIDGSPTDGKVYIYLIPSGDPALGTATVTATYTNTAPTWSGAKQGWYGTAGAANYRYLPFAMTKATTTYSNKYMLYPNLPSVERIYANNCFVFSARPASNQGYTVGNTTKINFGTQEIDVGGVYDGSTKFTSLEIGYYHIKAEIGYVNQGGPTEYAISISIYKNNSTYKTRVYYSDFSGYKGGTYVISIIELCAVGDYYEIYFYSAGTSGAITTDSAFFGHNIFPIKNY